VTTPTPERYFSTEWPERLLEQIHSGRISLLLPRLFYYEDGQMRIAPAVVLSEQQRTTLEGFARGRRIPARLVERARIVLLTADGQQDSQIAEVLSIPRQKAARWRKRFLALGIAGLEKDAPRPGRPPVITEQTIQDVVARTTQTRPAHATHWSTRTMAQAVNISEASVRRIWKLHGLKPHRVESFKLSNDPQFAEKLQDVIDLYLHPPEHAWVLSLDEKSQIQAGPLSDHDPRLQAARYDHLVCRAQR